MKNTYNQKVVHQQGKTWSTIDSKIPSVFVPKFITSVQLFRNESVTNKQIHFRIYNISYEVRSTSKNDEIICFFRNIGNSNIKHLICFKQWSPEMVLDVVCSAMNLKACICDSHQHKMVLIYIQHQITPYYKTNSLSAVCPYVFLDL